MFMADVSGTGLQLAVALQLRHLGFETSQDA
jgi:hypothetical protein